MEMNCQMLAELIAPNNSVYRHNTPFSRIQLYTGTTPDPDTLYLSDRRTEDDDAGIFIVDGPDGINCALAAHQNYLHWREQSLRLANVEHDLDGLLEISAAFLECDLWIVTPDYQMQAGSTRLYGTHLQSYTRIPQYEVENLYQENPEFDETFRQRGLLPYPQYELSGAKLYYYNLFQEDLYLGRLLITMAEHRTGPGMMQMVEQVCSDVDNCYRYLFLHRSHGHRSHRLYDLWRELLEGRTVDQDAAAELLKQMGWSDDHSYRILHLVPTGYFHSEQTLKYYAVLLESTLPSCFAVQLGNGLYCLYNLSADTSRNFRRQLSEFLRENLFRVGISNPFQNFFESRRYRHQAEDALRIGMMQDPSLWRYDFSDYVGDYTLSQCLAHYPAIDLCPKNLRTLVEYDRLHPETQLAQTLYEYYTCQFNAQTAADRLCIHRTTFFYRMNKIHKLASFHPEDPKETLQILLAFAALRLEEAEK